MNNKYTVGDLFAGAGGLSKAFEQAGADIVWANESDRYACNIYRKNFSNVCLVEGDIKEIEAKKILDIDILVGRFPCQPLSIVEQRNGFYEGRENLFFGILKILKAKKPKVFLLESVNGVMLHDKNSTFKIITEALQNEGYYTKSAVLNPIEYGNIPYNKKRVYIVGFRDIKEFEMFEFPQKIQLTNKLSDIINLSEIKDEKYYSSKSIDILKEIKGESVEKAKIYKLRYDRNNGRRYFIAEHDICPALTLYINNPQYIPMVKDDFGIRMLTLMECFGFQGYFDINIPAKVNEDKLYKYAAECSSVTVVERIAENILGVFGDGLSKSNKYNQGYVIKDKIDFYEDFIGENEEDKFTQITDEFEILINKVEWETDIQKKGKALENLMVKFFSEVRGFEDIKSNIRTETEEIDIIIINRSDNHIFKKEASFILVECKNWHSKVGRYNLDSFEKKVSNRNGRCSIGFFVSWNGITSEFDKELLRGSREKNVIVILDKNKIKEAIKSKDIERYLEQEFCNEILR